MTLIPPFDVVFGDDKIAKLHVWRHTHQQIRALAPRARIAA
jgi:hypothetical protein